ncbi:MAG: hypothetical protein IKP61_10725 [Spirochaetales bacterium]|nr:hypothetical protein [Spirochaetales bacterium]
MKRLMLLIFILILLPVCLFCETTTVVIEGFKVDTQGNEGAYLFPKLWDSNNNDMSVVVSSEVGITARGASGDGILAFVWVLYGNYYQDASVTFSVSPMTYVDDQDQVNYLPFTLTFVCEDTMVSHFTVPYNGTPISNSSFTTRNANTTYTFQYSDFIKRITAEGNTINNPASLSSAKASLSWDVNPGAGTHTGDQSFSVLYSLSSKSKVSIGNNVISDSNNYPNLCNQWNRSGSVYIKINTNANAEYTKGGVVYTAASGVYTSTITVTCTGV